ncbi:phage terminase large subunit family protein [Niveispirillum lacus]|nr:terminase gpA endonuclease subunit [Niveispirillum lacus]
MTNIVTTRPMEAMMRTAPEARQALGQLLRIKSRGALLPPPRLTVDQWADEFRVLGPEGNAIPGKWRTSTQEVARGPMRAVTEPGVRTITIMSCTQIMKTSCLENTFGYFAHLDPCPILFVQPKEDAVQTFSKKKISPLIRHSPVLRDLVRDAADRDGKSTQAYKKFPGGDLLITAAGSPTNLAMISIRVVGLDEVDKYSTTPEGDPILLAEERMSSFVANSLSIRTCSPTTKEGSISKSYASSDQRRPYVRCPHCDHEQILRWSQVQWDKDEDGNHQPETARVYCEGCGAGWTDRERHHAIRTTIRWRQTRRFRCCGEDQDPQVTRMWDWDDEHLIGRALCRHCGKRAVSNRHAGYWASKLYSCTQTVSELVYKWITVQDDVEQLRFFINTQLAEEYEERGQKLDDGVLMSRRESYSGIIPDDSSLLVCSVDVQDNRLEALIVSYGIDECSSVIDHVVIPGDPGQGHVWLELDKLLKTPVSRWDGRAFHIQATTIDTGGHHAQRVYEFAAARAGRRVWAIKGASERNGQRSPVWPSKVSMSKSGKTFYIVGTNAAKDQIHARLKIESHGPGYIRFGQNLEKDFFEQLTAEKLVTVHERGEYRRYWKNPERKRNESWDLICYAYAALCGLKAYGLRLNTYVSQRAPSGSVTAAPAAGPGFASAPNSMLSSAHDVEKRDRHHSSPVVGSPDIGPAPRVAPAAGQPARPADHSAAGPAPSPQPPPPAPAPKAKRRSGPRFVMGMR